MKKRIVTCMLAVTLLTCPAFATSFPDVDETAEYVEAAEYLSEVGIMEGDTEGNFNPDQAVTRAEMATIICRMLGETEGLTTSNDFADVPTNHWANTYIGKAAELGIVNGYDTGLFGPSDNVTYEQAVTMVVRTAGWETIAQNYGGYPDGYLSVASEYGLLNNITALKGELLSRADIAMIVFNFYRISSIFEVE